MRSLLLLLALAAGCAPTGEQCLGLDANGDGVCDREAADWSESFELESGAHRANIFDLDPDALQAARDAGLHHALVWPVDVTGFVPPRAALHRLFDDPDNASLTALARGLLGFGSMEELYAWLGLPAYPQEGLPDPYRVPYPEGLGPGDPMGAAGVPTPDGEALAFSCAACHASELFGRTVMGMTNKRARPNAMFDLVSTIVPALEPEEFERMADASPGEVAMYERLRDVLPAIGSKEPMVTGLDTSLAQVALSLARRTPDADATRSRLYEDDPTPNDLQWFVADSKPAVWWTMKYKTRWLADGSIVRGNPVFTNFLWNELGRGTDLPQLHAWLQENPQAADELTVAVFASEAPRWVDFFGADSLDLALAQQGEVEFVDRCSECHGTYEHDWSDGSVRSLAYHARTPVLDVGTDPQRAQGMQHFSDGLNQLTISQWMDTVVQPQDGYVPPPLDGIWARYPYLHNNAVPSLCALLTPAAERPSTFVQGPSADASTDFDADCVGYPVGDGIPEAWWQDEDAVFDATEPGLSNAGHDEMLVGLAEQQRSALIEYLKTL